MQGQSVKNQVYEGILKDILDGIYEANAIINEKTLVDKYQVSKTPVREALVQLCTEGILNNIPRFGYQLSVITPSEIHEIIEFRKLIEIGGLELCFHQITEAQIEELKQLNREASQITYEKDTKIHWAQNQEFHRRLCSFCQNRYIQKSLENSLKVCTRIANQYFTKVWGESKLTDGINHVMLVDALEQRDLERAKEILIMDVRAFRDEIR